MRPARLRRPPRTSSLICCIRDNGDSNRLLEAPRVKSEGAGYPAYSIVLLSGVLTVRANARQRTLLPGQTIRVDVLNTVHALVSHVTSSYKEVYSC